MWGIKIKVRHPHIMTYACLGLQFLHTAFPLTVVDFFLLANLAFAFAFSVDVCKCGK